LLTYSSAYSVWISHRIWQANWKKFIRRHLFIDRALGVVIDETAETGNEVTLYHGVTLGHGLEQGKMLSDSGHMTNGWKNRPATIADCSKFSISM
jgi:serine acetyltransferase